MSWKRVFLFIGLLAVLGSGFLVWVMQSSFPQQEGEKILPGLRSQVKVRFDRFGNPTISADTKLDAYYSLGYLTAQNRMFQMDMMRRKISGRLSEVFGSQTLEMDIWHRQNGFNRAANKIVQTLPSDQRRLLQAYVDGINTYLSKASMLPIEFLALGYTPEPWREEDSILVSLSMFQQLTWTEADERMVSVINEALPKEVAAFLMPRNDNYNSSVLLVGAKGMEQNIPEIPVLSLQELNRKSDLYAATELVDAGAVRAGSNQWAVNKTEDGRAILANDMHLPLTVPNLWYQAALNYEGVSIRGITLPGLPLVVAGSNGSIAWGYTNAQADVLDLVVLKKKPGDVRQYQTREGWSKIFTVQEAVKVKGEEDRSIDVRRTVWGPVSPRLLMGNEVAVQWTAFNPQAVNLDLAGIDRIRNMEEALSLFNQAGLPVMNVILADHLGNISWTLTGRIPVRVNFNGSISVSHAEDQKWAGFIPSNSYPRVKNPSSGFLVTANNRVLPADHPFQYGNNFANSYRAFRIAELLKPGERFTVADMHRMQLDTKSEFYRFYQQLSASVLSREEAGSNPSLSKIKKAIENWDGYANEDSIGFGILVEFRRRLANAVFTPYFQECKKLDANFKYRWYQMDTPLRALLSRRLPETLPGGLNYESWNDLILDVLTQTAVHFEQHYPDISLEQLEWGQIESFQLKHPFSKANKWMSFFLDLPEEPLSGCVHCVRVSKRQFAASMRMVVSPGHEEEMVLVEPTGQSGHPFSRHYKDKFHYWVRGIQIKMNDDDGDGEGLILRPQKEVSEQT